MLQSMGLQRVKTRLGNWTTTDEQINAMGFAHPAEYYYSVVKMCQTLCHLILHCSLLLPSIFVHKNEWSVDTLNIEVPWKNRLSDWSQLQRPLQLQRVNFKVNCKLYNCKELYNCIPLKALNREIYIGRKISGSLGTGTRGRNWEDWEW